MVKKILALDLAKSKTVSALHTAGTEDFVFQTTPTTPQELHDLIVTTEPDLVIMEISAMASWVYDLVAALHKQVLVTATNGPGWKWKNVRCKTDRGDAVKMIKMYLSGQLEPVHMPARDVREWRTLIAFRHDAVRDRTAAINRVRAILGRHAIASLPSSKWTLAYLAELRAMARPLADCAGAELWRGLLHEALQDYHHLEDMIARLEAKLEQIAARREAVALLQEDKGVGPRLSEMIVALIDDPLRFRSGKQVACYAGLTPRQWESGQRSMDGHISKQGSRLLRTLLVEVAWLGLRHQPWMKELYERIKKGSKKRGKIAIVAVARRLLVRLWARWRDAQKARLRAAGA